MGCVGEERGSALRTLQRNGDSNEQLFCCLRQDHLVGCIIVGCYSHVPRHGALCSRSVASHVFLISQVGFPSVRFCQSANTAADTVPSSTAAMAVCVRVRNRGAVSCYLARLLRFQFLFTVAS
jgi:hypothetical protein